MQLRDLFLPGLALVAAVVAPQLVAIPVQEPPPTPQPAAIVDLAVHLLVGLDHSGPEQHLLALLVIDLHSAQIRLGQARLRQDLDSAVVEDSIDSDDFVATLQTVLEWSIGFRLLVLQGTRRASPGRFHSP